MLLTGAGFIATVLQEVLQTFAALYQNKLK